MKPDGTTGMEGGKRSHDLNMVERTRLGAAAAHAPFQLGSAAGSEEVDRFGWAAQHTPVSTNICYMTKVRVTNEAISPNRNKLSGLNSGGITM